MWTRRGLLASGGVAALVGTTGTALSLAGAVDLSGPPDFTFVSMPDFFNADVADLRGLPTWDGGMNSWNQWWQLATDTCLTAVAAHRPDAVLVAGDQVEGRWNIDSDGRQIFGQVSQGTDEVSLAMCRSAITRAGQVYYPHYKKVFADRDLPLYPAIGDHEILDDRSGPLDRRWSSSGTHKGRPDNRYYLVDHAKSVWADHFTRTSSGAPLHRRRPVGSQQELTAYSVDFADVMTLITVDVFHRTGTGVRLGVFGPQLAWLEKEVKRAKRKGHVAVVQGHIPALGPYRVFASGNLHMPEGERSAFWQALERAGADFYLCGEVHDATAIQPGARKPVQISHGCTYRHGFSYLVGRVWQGGRVELEYHEMPQVSQSEELGIWATDAAKLAPNRISYSLPVVRGRMEWEEGTILSRTEKLGVFDPANDPYAYQKPPTGLLGKARKAPRPGPPGS
ncbi:MAG: metallophosphoesterase family protein [Nocardioides sp.]